MKKYLSVFMLFVKSSLLPFFGILLLLFLFQTGLFKLYLEKAMTLGDTITRRQVPGTGMIPTFWMGENCAEGHRNFWINCQIGTAFYMLRLAELTEAEGIE